MADISPDKLNSPYPQQLDADFEPITWQAFRNTGLLAFVNGFLHIFGLVITVQDAINLLLQAPDKSAPLSINSTSFFSELSLTHTDNCFRMDATATPYVNAVTYGH